MRPLSGDTPGMPGFRDAAADLFPVYVVLAQCRLTWVWSWRVAASPRHWRSVRALVRSACGAAPAPPLPGATATGIARKIVPVPARTIFRLIGDQAGTGSRIR